MNLGKHTLRLLALTAAVLLALQMEPTQARADDDDTFKALLGVAALAMIAGQARQNRLEREAAAQSARNQVERRVEENRVCRTPSWNGSNWQEPNGRPCLPTPSVCLRERWRGEFLLKYFDADCMRQEGFRLSRSY